MSEQATSVKKQFTFDLNSGGLGPMEIVQKDPAQKETPIEKEIITSNEKNEEGGEKHLQEQKVNPIQGKEGDKEEGAKVPDGRDSDPNEPNGGASQEDGNEEAEKEGEGNSTTGIGSEEENEDNDEVETENVGYYLAKQLQVEGFLPEDFEVGEDISKEDIYQAYKDTNYNTLAGEVISDVQQQLQREGVTKEMLQYARAIQNGIDLETLNAASMHNRFSKLKLGEDLSHEDKIASIKAMHSARGLSEKDSSRLLTASENSGELDNDFEESTQFHQAKVKEFAQLESQRAQQVEEERQRLEALQVNAINKAAQERNVLGQPLTPEQAGALREDIYSQNQVVSINGQSYKASAFQAWMYEFENNPEAKLHAFIAYKYRDRAQEVAEQAAKAKVEKNFLDDYTKLAKKKTTNSSKVKTKTNKKEEEKQAPKTQKRTIQLSLT